MLSKTFISSKGGKDNWRSKASAMSRDSDRRDDRRNMDRRPPTDASSERKPLFERERDSERRPLVSDREKDIDRKPPTAEQENDAEKKPITDREDKPKSVVETETTDTGSSWRRADAKPPAPSDDTKKDVYKPSKQVD